MARYCIESSHKPLISIQENSGFHGEYTRENEWDWVSDARVLDVSDLDNLQCQIIGPNPSSRANTGEYQPGQCVVINFDSIIAYDCDICYPQQENPAISVPEQSVSIDKIGSGISWGTSNILGTSEPDAPIGPEYDTPNGPDTKRAKYS